MCIKQPRSALIQDFCYSNSQLQREQTWGPNDSYDAYLTWMDANYKADTDNNSYESRGEIIEQCL